MTAPRFLFSPWFSPIASCFAQGSDLLKDVWSNIYIILNWFSGKLFSLCLSGSQELGKLGSDTVISTKKKRERERNFRATLKMQFWHRKFISLIINQAQSHWPAMVSPSIKGGQRRHVCVAASLLISIIDVRESHFTPQYFNFNLLK